MTYRQIDADTFQDETTGEVVRLADTNAPEKRTPYGAALAQDPSIKARADQSTLQRMGRDYYGRTVGRMHVPDAPDLNQQLISEGKAGAVDYTGAGAAYSEPRVLPGQVEPPLDEPPQGTWGTTTTPTPEPTLLQSMGNAVRRGVDTGQAGLFGALAATGEMIARDPDGAGPRTDMMHEPPQVPDRVTGKMVANPALSLRDRFSNWLLRTGEAGYQRNTREAELNPRETTLQQAIERGTFKDWMTFAFETMGEAAPSMLLMVGAGAATALTGGAAGAAVGAAAARGALGVGAQTVARQVAVRQAERIMTQKMLAKLVAAGATPVQAAAHAASLAANLPARLAEVAARRAFTAGMFGSSAAMQGGEFYKTLENETGIRAPFSSLVLAGGLAGALDVGGFEVVLKHLLKPGIDIKRARDIIKPVLSKAAFGATAEGVTETLQEVIGVLNTEYFRPSDVPLPERMLSKENLWRYAEAGAAGIVFGAGFGGAGGLAQGTGQYFSQKQPPSPPVVGAPSPVIGAEPLPPVVGAPSPVVGAEPLPPVVGAPSPPSSGTVQLKRGEEVILTPGGATVSRATPEEQEKLKQLMGERPTPTPISKLADHVARGGNVTPQSYTAEQRDHYIKELDDAAKVFEARITSGVNTSPGYIKAQTEFRNKVQAAKNTLVAIRDSAATPSTVAPTPTDEKQGAQVQTPEVKTSVDPIAAINGVVDYAHYTAKSNGSSLQSEIEQEGLLASPAFDAIASTGSDVPSHGMAKKFTSAAVRDILSMRDTDTVPKHYAPLAITEADRGSGGGTTASDAATRTGPFILVGRKNGAFDKFSDVTALLVNPAIKDVVPHLQQLFPELQVTTFDKVGSLSFERDTPPSTVTLTPTPTPTDEKPASAETQQTQAQPPVGVPTGPEGASETREGATGTRAFGEALAEKIVQRDKRFSAKDAAKARVATQFIGEGGVKAGNRSSETKNYVDDANATDKTRVNSGQYTADDRVFVSVNGNFTGRVPLLTKDGQLNGAYQHLAAAVAAKATILADSKTHRDSGTYNTGEAELAQWLASQGYVEAPVTDGAYSYSEWRPSTSVTPKLSTAGQHVADKQYTPDQKDAKALKTDIAALKTYIAQQRKLELSDADEAKLAQAEDLYDALVSTVDELSVNASVAETLSDLFTPSDTLPSTDAETITDQVAAANDNTWRSQERLTDDRQAVGWVFTSEEHARYVAERLLTPLLIPYTVSDKGKNGRYALIVEPSTDQAETTNERRASILGVVPQSVLAAMQAAADAVGSVDGIRGIRQLAAVLWERNPKTVNKATYNSFREAAQAVSEMGLQFGDFAYSYKRDAEYPTIRIIDLKGRTLPVAQRTDTFSTFRSDEELDQASEQRSAGRTVRIDQRATELKPAVVKPTEPVAPPVAKPVSLSVEPPSSTAGESQDTETDSLIAQLKQIEDATADHADEAILPGHEKDGWLTSKEAATFYSKHRAILEPLLAKGAALYDEYSGEDSKADLGITNETDFIGNFIQLGLKGSPDATPVVNPNQQDLFDLEEPTPGALSADDQLSRRQSLASGLSPEQFLQGLPSKARQRATASHVHVLARTSDAPFFVPPDTAGLYLPNGEVYFFTENIAKGEPYGKFVHELGAHFGLSRMVGAEAYAAILARLQEMVRTPDRFASVKEAYQRSLKANGVDSPALWHDTLGYLGEISPRHGLIRRLIQAIRTFLRDLGLPLGRLTEQDIVGLLQTAAMYEGQSQGGAETGGLRSVRTDLRVAPYRTLAANNEQVTRYGIWSDDRLLAGFITSLDAEAALARNRAKYEARAPKPAEPVIPIAAPLTRTEDAAKKAAKQAANTAARADQQQAAEALKRAQDRLYLVSNLEKSILALQQPKSPEERAARMKLTQRRASFGTLAALQEQLDRAQAQYDAATARIEDEAAVTRPAPPSAEQIKSWKAQGDVQVAAQRQRNMGAIDRLRAASSLARGAVDALLTLAHEQERKLGTIPLTPLTQGRLQRVAQRALARSPEQRDNHLVQVLSTQPGRYMKGPEGQPILVPRPPVGTAHAEVVKVFEAIRRLVTSGMNPALRDAALDHLYTLHRPALDYLRASTAYVGENLSLAAHFGQVSDLFDQAQQRDASTLHELVVPKKLADEDTTEEFHALQKLKAQGVEVDAVERGEEQAWVLFKGKYFTDLLSQVLQPLLDSQTPDADQVMRARRSEAARARTGELEQRLLDLRDQAAASSDHTASEDLGDAAALFDATDPRASLTPLGQLLVRYLVETAQVDPEKLPKASGIGRFLKVLRTQQALHAMDSWALPMGRLALRYNAKSNDYELVEEWASSNTNLVKRFVDWRTGLTTTVKEYVRDFLTQRGMGARLREPMPDGSWDAWRTRGVTLVALKDFLSPAEVVESRLETAPTEPRRRVTIFRGKQAWLSNFAPAPVVLDGVTYPTVEHAFQASKVPPDQRAPFLALDVVAAKRRGAQVTLIPGWDGLAVMRDLIQQKFAPGTVLAEALKETGDAYISHENKWGDEYWGVDQVTKRGTDHLGRMLMAQRAVLLGTREALRLQPPPAVPRRTLQELREWRKQPGRTREQRQQAWQDWRTWQGYLRQQAERVRLSGEQVVRANADKVRIDAKAITQLGWMLGKADGRVFFNEYEAFQYGRLALLEEAGLHIAETELELGTKNISGKKGGETLYAQAQAEATEAQLSKATLDGWTPMLGSTINRGAALFERVFSEAMSHDGATVTDAFAQVVKALEDTAVQDENALLETEGTLTPTFRGTTLQLSATSPFGRLLWHFKRIINDPNVVRELPPMDLALTGLTPPQRVQAIKAEQAKRAETQVELEQENSQRVLAALGDWYAVQAAKTESRGAAEYEKQYAMDTGNAPVGLQTKKMGQEQDAADATRQQGRERWDRINATSTLADPANVQNLPVEPGFVKGDETTPGYQMIKAIVEKLGLRNQRITLFNKTQLNDMLKTLRILNPELKAEFGMRQEDDPVPAAVVFTRGQVLIYHDDTLADDLVAEHLGHEMGHVVYRTLLDQERTRNSVVWQRILRQYSQSNQSQGFMEWFADEVATWALHGQVRNATDSFFRRVVEAIKTMLGSLGLVVGKGAVSAYLDGLALREAKMSRAELARALAGYGVEDLQTVQMSRYSTTSPLLRVAPNIDYWSLNGLRQGSTAQAQRFMDAVPFARRWLDAAKGAGRVANDVFATMNGWLREQVGTEFTLLADILENQPRQARAVSLLSNAQIVEQLRADPRWANLTQTDHTPYLRERLDQANALRSQPGVAGVTLLMSVHPSTGERIATVVPVHQETFSAAVRRLAQGHWGSGPQGHRQFTHGLDETQSRALGEELLRNQPSSDPAKKLSAWLKTFFTEYVSKGFQGATSRQTHIGQLKDWGLARYYDADKVEQDLDGFVKIMTTDYPDWEAMSIPDAMQLANDIIVGKQQREQTDLEENSVVSTLAPGAKSKKHRNITIPIDVLMPYLETRADKILETYVHAMVKRVEWERRLGAERQIKREGKTVWTWDSGYYTTAIKQAFLFNHGKTLSPERMSYIQDRVNSMLEAYLGRYGMLTTDPRVRTGMAWASVVANYLVLPLSLLSQPPDLAGPVTRMGGGLGAYAKGIRDAVQGIRDKGGSIWTVAELLGVVYRDLKNSGASVMLDQHLMSESAAAANDRLFKWIGMQFFSNFTRLAAFQTSKYWLHSLVADPDGARLLSQVSGDLSLRDITDWQAAGSPDYTGVGESGGVAYRVMLARMRFVAESAFSPTSAQRPLLANHPYGMLLFALKQYAYTFYVQMLKPALRELRDNPTNGGKLLAVLPLALMIPLAMLGMGLRDWIKYGDLPWRDGDAPRFDTDTEGYFSQMGRIISRTGILGPLQLLIDADRQQSWGRSFTFSLLGPVASKVEEQFLTENTLDRLLRMTPGTALLPAERGAILQWWRGD